MVLPRTSPCDNHDCANGAQCVVMGTDPVCQCLQGYEGLRCERLVSVNFVDRESFLQIPSNIITEQANISLQVCPFNTPIHTHTHTHTPTHEYRYFLLSFFLSYTHTKTRHSLFHSRTHTHTHTHTQYTHIHTHAHLSQFNSIQFCSIQSALLAWKIRHLHC